ncbi:ABC transporter permease [Streptosporangium carneum]|nr:ABC transporter permease [Streptosporangium carneum]
MSVNDVGTEGTAAADAPNAPEGGPGRSPYGRAGDLARRVPAMESMSVLVATVALVVVIGVIHPDFLSAGQLLDMLQASVYVGLLAGGMAFLISMREIDLSVGSMFGLSLISMGLLINQGFSPWLAGLLGVLLGGVLGLINALVVQFIGIPTIVATLATLSVYRGLALALSEGQQVTGMPVDDSFFTILGGKVLGVQTSIWVLVAVTVLLTVVLRFTSFGYRVRAIGSNPDAATFSGISANRVRMQVLVLMGLLAGVAAALGLAFFTSGDPNIGTGFELQAIAAAVIGGTPLRGGTATVVGAVFGGILLAVVGSGLQYFNIPVNWSSFATGAVILLAVSLDSLLRRRRRRKDAELGL